tara:strand:+ start:68 stop:430 length:363 start_codon:yes stop_codon:yes gene_type:complete
MSKSLDDQEDIKKIIANDTRESPAVKQFKSIKQQVQLSNYGQGSVWEERRGDSQGTERSSLASILHKLKEELKSQNDLLKTLQAQDWKDEDEFITLGWIEGLEFAIKLIEEHNRSCEADQ